MKINIPASLPEAIKAAETANRKHEAAEALLKEREARVAEICKPYTEQIAALQAAREMASAAEATEVKEARAAEYHLAKLRGDAAKARALATALHGPEPDADDLGQFAHDAQRLVQHLAGSGYFGGNEVKVQKKPVAGLRLVTLGSHYESDRETVRLLIKPGAEPCLIAAMQLEPSSHPGDENATWTIGRNAEGEMVVIRLGGQTRYSVGTIKPLAQFREMGERYAKLGTCVPTKRVAVKCTKHDGPETIIERDSYDYRGFVYDHVLPCRIGEGRPSTHNCCPVELVSEVPDEVSA